MLLRKVRHAAWTVFALTLAGQTWAQNAGSPDKKAAAVYKNIQVMKDVPSDNLVPAMQFITSALGVRCEYCHVENAFEKDDKKAKQTARKMMQMMFAINANNFEGRQEVTCYSCHRGSPKPLAIPAIAETPAHLLNEAPAAEQSAPNLPNANVIVHKYIEALGGEAAISKLSSLEEKGMFAAGQRQFPVEVLRKFPNHIAVITHFPNGDSVTAYNGGEGFTSFPGRPARPMMPGDIAASQMDADLQFAIDLPQKFGNLQAERTETIADRDAVMISARRPGQAPLELYFDAENGLLLRLVRYAESPLGLNPTQLDYSDYRDVNGMKLPFRWVSATPTGRFTIQIESAQANVPIPEQKFQKPVSTGAP